MELSFCELRNKDVINVCDGKNLGQINDMIIDTCCGRITGITVPCNKSFLSIFRSNNDIFIPYNRICKIGKDIILVDIIMHEQCSTDCCSQSKKEYNLKEQQFQDSEKINIQSLLNKTLLK